MSCGIFTGWMALYGMWASALFGGTLTLASFSSWHRHMPRWGLIIGWALVPVVIWQVALPEYVVKTHRLACKASAASGKPYAMCDDVEYERRSSGDTGPVFSTRERLAVQGFNHILAFGGGLTGHHHVAWETFLLTWGERGEEQLDTTTLRAQTLGERRRLCRLGAANGGRTVVNTSDFFLDSSLFRQRVAQLADEARRTEVGSIHGPVSGSIDLPGRSNNEVYGNADRPVTLRTALALYVPGATLTAERLKDNRLRVRWTGPMYYPPRAGFSASLPTLHGRYSVRLDESVFCALQMDGAMRPYKQAWETVIPLDDPRLQPTRTEQSAPGWFELMVFEALT